LIKNQDLSGKAPKFIGVVNEDAGDDSDYEDPFMKRLKRDYPSVMSSRQTSAHSRCSSYDRYSASANSSRMAPPCLYMTNDIDDNFNQTLSEFSHRQSAAEHDINESQDGLEHNASIDGEVQVEENELIKPVEAAEEPVIEEPEESQDEKVGRVLRESSVVSENGRKCLERVERVTTSCHKVIGHTDRINKNFEKLANVVTRIQRQIAKDEWH